MEKQINNFLEFLQKDKKLTDNGSAHTVIITIIVSLLVTFYCSFS